ncbi:MAG: hypothetical protein U0L98_00675 [Clostridia bacterium]|nr:hypothetical protein [Clostridia bacterium]
MRDEISDEGKKLINALENNNKPFSDNPIGKILDEEDQDPFRRNMELFRQQSSRTDVASEQKIKSRDKRRENGKSKGKRPKGKRPKGRIFALLMSGVLFAGGIAGGLKGKEDQKIGTKIAVSLLEETPQSLGITQEEYDKINSIKDSLENNKLSDDEIPYMAKELYDLYNDVIKMKLANTLGVNDDKIVLDQYVEEGRTIQLVIVKLPYKESIYRTRDFATFQNSISKEIDNSIIDLTKMQTIMGEIQEGNYSNDKLLKEYKKIINNIDTLAASGFIQDDFGNISVKAIENKDVEKLRQKKNNIQPPKRKIQEEYKTSQESYSVNANGNVENQDTVKLEYDDDHER